MWFETNKFTAYLVGERMCMEIFEVVQTWEIIITE